MKSFLKNLSFLFLAVMFVSVFTACNKDSEMDELNNTQEPTETNTTTSNNNPTTTLLALGQSGQIENDSMDLCDCFALFDGIDWNASPSEIEAQIEAILATLMEAQIEELFTPVCTSDGKIYINSCVADCNGVTDYEECEADDYCDDFDDYCDDYEDCFEINYPISLLLNDGTTVTANSDDELEDIFEDWETNSPNLPEPQVIFPFDVTVDNMTVTINNEDEFEGLLESCDDDYGHGGDEFELCFDFVYPLNIVLPDDSTATVNDEDELWDTVEDWYDANPNSNDDPTLEYPVDVVLEDGTIMTVNNDDELEDLVESCFDFDLDDCFSFVYPIEILFPDGSITAVNSDDELITTIDDWYDANPNNNDDPTLVFPIQVELEDGTIQMINDEDELDDLFEDCYGDWGGCFVTGDSSNALSKSGAKINFSKKN